MDELVQQRFEPIGVVAEHRGRRLQARDVAMVIGAEHVDEPVEPARELVAYVRDVCREVEKAPVRGADQRAVLVVAVRRRASPHRPLGLVGVELCDRVRGLELDLALPLPDVEPDAKSLERPLDALEHRRHRVAGQLRELVDVLALVAVWRRLVPTTARLDRLAKAIHLPTAVVVVVLARHVVPGEREQACDGIAVRAVPGRGDRDRPGRVRGDHLDVHALRLLGRAAAVLVADLRECRRQEGIRDEQVEEARACNLGALDVRELSRALRELLRELARWTPPCGRKPQRDVRRVVAVRRIGGPLEQHLRTGELPHSRGETLDRVSGQRPGSGRRDPRGRESRRQSRRRRRRLRRGASSPRKAACRTRRPDDARR